MQMCGLCFGVGEAEETENAPGVFCTEGDVRAFRRCIFRRQAEQPGGRSAKFWGREREVEAGFGLALAGHGRTGS